MEKLIWLLAFLAVPSFAELPQDLYKAGNALYAEGKFSEAAQKYQSASDQGLRNWALDYNLGNAYYRSGQTGKAIFHYERAFRMNSGQADVIYNLQLATTQTGDPELPAGALPAAAWRLFYFLSVNALTLWVSALFLFFVTVAALELLGRNVLKGDWVFGVGILFIALSGWLGARIYLLEKPEGIVVSSVVEVRSGPNMTYPANSTVPEGRRILLLKEQEPIEGWLEIGVPQEGLKGWVPDASVEVL